MSSNDALLELVKARRSHYKLGKKNPVPDSKVEELVENAILHIPSAFNTQSTRLVVLLGNKHERLWDITAETFGALVTSGAVPREVWENQTKSKIEGFKAAYGTILFYEDPAHIKPFQERFPAFAAQFPSWAEHSNAMHQWFLWAGLQSLGFGANLQHYNPLIDAAVSKEFNVPSDYQLRAQMVFGSIETPAAHKQFKPVGERVKVYGKQ